MATETRGTPILDGLGRLNALPLNLFNKLIGTPFMNAIGGPWGGGAVPKAPGATPEDQAYRDYAVNMFANPNMDSQLLMPWEQELLRSYQNDPNVPKTEVAALIGDAQRRQAEQAAQSASLAKLGEGRDLALGRLNEKEDALNKMVSSGDYLSNELYNSAFQAVTDAGAKNAARTQAGANRSAAAGGFRDAGFLSSRVGQARDAANIAAGQTMAGIRKDVQGQLTGVADERAKVGEAYKGYESQILGNPAWRSINLPDFTGYGVGNRNQVIGQNTMGLGALTTAGSTLTGNLLNTLQLAGQGAQNGMGMLLNGRRY